MQTGETQLDRCHGEHKLQYIEYDAALLLQVTPGFATFGGEQGRLPTGLGELAARKLPGPYQRSRLRVCV